MFFTVDYSHLALARFMSPIFQWIKSSIVFSLFFSPSLGVNVEFFQKKLLGHSGSD